MEEAVGEHHREPQGKTCGNETHPLILHTFLGAGHPTKSYMPSKGTARGASGLPYPKQCLYPLFSEGDTEAQRSGIRMFCVE